MDISVGPTLVKYCTLSCRSEWLARDHVDLYWTFYHFLTDIVAAVKSVSRQEFMPSCFADTHTSTAAQLLVQMNGGNLGVVVVAAPSWSLQQHPQLAPTQAPGHLQKQRDLGGHHYTFHALQARNVTPIHRAAAPATHSTGQPASAGLKIGLLG
jgi:hypothetical protein